MHERRITFTADRKHPGIQGPRHWLRSSPDGRHIAFMRRVTTGGESHNQIFVIREPG